MSKKFAIGAVIGAVAGVIAGVLTAPKSGKEVRADIGTKAKELKSKTEATAKHVADEVREAARDLKNDK